jgi:hypothetical protein
MSRHRTAALSEMESCLCLPTRSVRRASGFVHIAYATTGDGFVNTVALMGSNSLRRESTSRPLASCVCITCEASTIQDQSEAGRSGHFLVVQCLTKGYHHRLKIKRHFGCLVQQVDAEIAVIRVVTNWLRKDVGWLENCFKTAS